MCVATFHALYRASFLRIIATDFQSIIIDKHTDYDLLLCLYRLKSCITKNAVSTSYEGQTKSSDILSQIYVDSD